MDAHVTEYSAADRRKALFAIFVAAFSVGLAIGAAMPMIAMSMELRGMAASEIGSVVAAAPVGLIVMGPFIGHLVNRLGLLGIMLLGGLIVVCSLLIMPSIFGVLPWVITLGDRFYSATLAGANAALVTMYEIGGVCGPVLVGHAIDQLGPDGMPIVLVLSGVPVVLYYGYRRISKMKKEKQYGT